MADVFSLDMQDGPVDEDQDVHSEDDEEAEDEVRLQCHTARGCMSLVGRNAGVYAGA